MRLMNALCSRQPKSWFELGRDINWAVPDPLRPKQKDLRKIAESLGITQVDARRSLDFYSYGDIELIAGRSVPQVKINSVSTAQ